MLLKDYSKTDPHPADGDLFNGSVTFYQAGQEVEKWPEVGGTGGGCNVENLSPLHKRGEETP